MPKQTPIPEVLPLTEQQNPASLSLDQLDLAQAVELMHQQDYQVLEAIKQAQPAITATIKRLINCLQQGGRLFYTGAGTSGRLGVLDASECPPTFGTPPELIQGIIAGGTRALYQAVEGAEDHPEAAITDLQARELTTADMVIGIAASGSTPYVRSSLRYAHSLGCQTALLACTPVPQDDSAIDEYIILPVGPEIVTGSTRLKAGTATKMVLNMITTLAMVQMGKVYGNLMVDLNISNAKLVKRAQRMLQQLTGLSDPEATDQLLAAAQGEVKTAVLMHQAQLTYEQAQAVLQANGGQLRQALTASGVSAI